MAEILTSGSIEILKKLAFVVSEEIDLVWGVKDDLKKLQRTLEMVLAVISDAEKRQDKEESVRVWLRRLKGVAFEADDVMDELSYETMRRCERGDRLKHKVLGFVSSSNPLAFRFKMAKNIKHINRSLDELTKDMGRFQLQIATLVDTTIINGESSEQRRRQTTSFSSEPQIVGREDDKNEIINMLTNVTLSSTSSDRNPEKISIISLVGMGGLGKTTLAQLVYKDEFVGKHFETKIWVHVSEFFDFEILLIKIMESITQTKFDTGLNLEVLVNKVREQLNGKKYLLVLDDLWNEDADQWDRLKSVLHIGAQGSKILITTRKNQVATIVRGSTPPYNLKQLPDAACWCMIEQKAFSCGGAQNTQRMTTIGKEIAKKCYGLPLAAKFLGSLLHTKNIEKDWISIRDDDTWHTQESQSYILPVLKLSYNNLPSHLKQCFSFCSIFPKNWEIKKVSLIQMWMAEGFLKQSDVKNKKSVEDFGGDYFESLAWSSFFHNFERNELGDIEKCKMHDLVHDLAEDVCGEKELVSLKASELKDVSEVLRLRLELDEDLSRTFLKNLSHAKKLRTIFIPEGSNLDPVIFLGNKHLRSFHAGRSPDFSYPKLSSLSFQLRHLRYLHLTSLDLREVVNHHSINKLYSLETLILTCMYGVQNLLTNIQPLKKLRHLEISWTDMEELPDSVTSLCNLQTLDLNHSDLKVIPNSISGLKHLEFLNLSFNLIEELPGFVPTLSNLQTLDVNTCKNLKALPEYVAGLANLKIFDFKNCPLLNALPVDFGAITQLRSLNLEGTGIKVLAESCSNLKNLEILNLSFCELPKDVKSWTKLRKLAYSHRRKPIILGVGKLVCLQKLYYSVPEKLTDEPECNVGMEELGNLNLLENLAIVDLHNVKNPMDAKRANLKAKQNLRELLLHWGETEEELDTSNWDDKSCNFQVFEVLKPLTSLRYLSIGNFMGRDLPKWMCAPSCLPELIHLELKDCKKVKQIPAAIGHLSHLRILNLTGMLYLKRLDISGFLSLIELNLTDTFLLEELCYSYPCLQELRISGCKSLTEIPLFPSLKLLVLQKIDYKLVCSIGRCQTSLTAVSLENIEELIYFPLSILQNNCNLQYLQINECNQFQGFRLNDNVKNDNKVALLDPDLYSGSLETLQLRDCPVLKFLPDLRGWTSLRGLVIFKCPRVKESLTYDLKSLSFLKQLYVDFIQKDEQQEDPSTSEDLINLMNK